MLFRILLPRQHIWNGITIVYIFDKRFLVDREAGLGPQYYCWFYRKVILSRYITDYIAIGLYL